VLSGDRPGIQPVDKTLFYDQEHALAFGGLLLTVGGPLLTLLTFGGLRVAVRGAVRQRRRCWLRGPSIPRRTSKASPPAIEDTFWIRVGAIVWLFFRAPEAAGALHYAADFKGGYHSLQKQGQAGCVAGSSQRRVFRLKMRFHTSKGS